MAAPEGLGADGAAQAARSRSGRTRRMVGSAERAALCVAGFRGDRGAAAAARVVASAAMPTRVALLVLLCACSAPLAQPPHHPDVVAAEHKEAAARNAELVDRAKGSRAPVVFLGDSITEQWE